MTRKTDTIKPTKNLNQKEEDLLADIRHNFNLAQEVFSMQRKEAAEDFRFRAGDQWPEQIRKSREFDNRPCLEINKIGEFIKQVVNSQKINRPSINIKPGDSLAKIEIARVIQAIVKNIEINSMAENAYDTAFDNACTGGEGYFRIITDYCDPMSFNQDIQIKAIDNPFSVYIDPGFKSDFSDINWAFVYTDMQKSEYERLYPKSEVISSDLFVNETDWLKSDSVRIAEYFYIDYEDNPIVELKNGTVLTKEDYNKLDDATKESSPINRERVGQKKIVRWVKTNGHEILESTVFPGVYIPIIPVFANTYIVNGKRVFEGVVRHAKDAQRAYNFWTSAQAEMIALAPKAPYLVAEGQIEGHEAEWDNSNTSNAAYLEYKQVSHNGQPAPPPQRQQFDPNINSILQAKQSSDEDLKATTGIYDPSLGSDKKEASGKALITKQRQAEVGNFMYIDNLSKSLKYAGKVLMGMIPIVYDNKRVIRIIGGINQEDELVTINSAFGNKDPIFLDIGKYDCEVSIGPYGENQRQDAIESMLSLMQINPELSNLIGDIFVGKQDWDGAKEISERLKIMLPPALQQDKELPPEIQAQLAQAKAQYEQKIAADAEQMQQMQALIANTTAQLNKVTADFNNNQAEIESKERIAAMDNNTKLLIAGLKEDSADSRLTFQQELAFTQRKQAEAMEDIPQQGDEYVLPGVNDEITKENEDVNGDLTEEEKHALHLKLDGFMNGNGE